MKVTKIETMLYHDLMWYANKLGVSVKKMVRAIDKEFKSFVSCPICIVSDNLTTKQRERFNVERTKANLKHRDPEPYYTQGYVIWGNLYSHERMAAWIKVKARFKKEGLI